MAVFRSDRSGAAVAVGPLEGAILDILWDRGESMGVPEVYQVLTANERRISYSAVKAVLNNLTQKGWLMKDKRGKVTYFEALQNREEFNSDLVRNVIGSLKRNYGQPVIAHFVDQLAVDEDTLEELERQLARRKAELGE